MKAYVITTGSLFGIVTVAHILRMVHENPDLASSAWYVLITIATAALTVWAGLLLRRTKHE